MDRVLVVGAGFSGVWAAAGAVRTAERMGVEVEVTVVDPGDDMVVRPRLYERNPQDMRVSLDHVFGPIGVKRVAATVTEIDTDTRLARVVDRQGRTSELGYDRLVMAAGSALVRPDIPGSEYLFDSDTMQTAAELEAHIAGLPRREASEGRYTAVVVGAGFTGLEVATEMPAKLRDVAGGEPVRVVLLDRGEVLAKPLGDGPRPYIEQALQDHGIEVRLGVSPASLDEHGLTLEDGERIAADTVVWCVGMKASDVVAQIPGEHDKLGRLVVDDRLRVEGVSGVFATGDTASVYVDEDHRAMQACQHSLPMGKYAGHNVVADLAGQDLVGFDPEDYVTCLDLGPGHAVFTTGWEREVQMTGEDAKHVKAQINQKWIYPPVDDRDAILELADHTTTWPSL